MCWSDPFRLIVLDLFVAAIPLRRPFFCRRNGQARVFLGLDLLLVRRVRPKVCLFLLRSFV